MPADRFGTDYYGDHWLGDLAELIIYNRPLSLAERQTVEDYLLVKYRIEVTPGEPPPVAAPQISPNGSVFDSSVEVTLTTTTPHADIYYTLGGGEASDELPESLRGATYADRDDDDQGACVP